MEHNITIDQKIEILKLAVRVGAMAGEGYTTLKETVTNYNTMLAEVKEAAPKATS